MAKNPYTLVFGREPGQMISRATQAAEIIETFSEEDPSQQIYMITGVRGSGKTVFMTEIAKHFSEEDDWVAVELNPEKDMISELVSRLNALHPLAQPFRRAKIDLSFLGFGVSISGAEPVTDVDVALERMLTVLKEQNKRLLITVDEATGNKEMRIFAGSFQILLRKKMPVFLLMTGLYGNIDALQNAEDLTFLHRAPKITLKALNIGSIARNYRKNFDIDEGQALTMAHMTGGYAFAFQVLGYFTWEQGGDANLAQDDYRQYLEDYVYDKIWSEFSQKDKIILCAIAGSETGRVTEIRETLDMKSNEFSPYRKRLIRSGAVEGDTYGHLSFVLPYFAEYILENYAD